MLFDDFVRFHCRKVAIPGVRGGYGVSRCVYHGHGVYAWEKTTGGWVGEDICVLYVVSNTKLCLLLSKYCDHCEAYQQASHEHAHGPLLAVILEGTWIEFVQRDEGHDSGHCQFIQRWADELHSANYNPAYLRRASD